MIAAHPMATYVLQSQCAVCTYLLNGQSYNRWLGSHSTCSQGWLSQKRYLCNLLYYHLQCFSCLFYHTNVYRPHSFPYGRGWMMNGVLHGQDDLSAQLSPQLHCSLNSTPLQLETTI